MTRVGNMNQPALIQRLQKTADDMGGTTGTWVNVKTVWCEVKPLTGRQLMEAQKLGSNITHKVRMRYQAELPGPNVELKHTMRLSLDGGQRILSIHAVIPLTSAPEWEVLCSENERVS